MLSALTREGVSSGLLSFNVKGGANDLFVHAHFIQQTAQQGGNTLIYSKSLRSEEYEGICARYAIRLKPGQITVCNEIDIEKMNSLSPTPSCVIFEDISLWEQVYDMSPSIVTRAVLKAVDVTAERSSSPVVYVSTTQDCPSFSSISIHANARVSVELIGSGYLKDVTGSLSISFPNSPSSTRVHYLVTERAATCTYPGQTSLRM